MSDRFTLVKGKKRVSNVVPGKYIEHTYKMKDNWDGNFCCDYCIGCGACDHFPTRYAVFGYKQTVRELSYYCKKCDDERKNGFFSSLLGNDENENKILPADVELKEGYVEDKNGVPTVTCARCNEHYGKNMYVTKYSYYTRTLCECCGKKLGIKETGYERCREKFWCDNCETYYEISNRNYKTIQCEQISKLKEYRSNQLFINANGEVSTNQIVEKLE